MTLRQGRVVKMIIQWLMTLLGATDWSDLFQKILDAIQSDASKEIILGMLLQLRLLVAQQGGFLSFLGVPMIDMLINYLQLSPESLEAKALARMLVGAVDADSERMLSHVVSSAVADARELLA